LFYKCWSFELSQVFNFNCLAKYMVNFPDIHTPFQCVNVSKFFNCHHFYCIKVLIISSVPLFSFHFFKN
jgi:hypothetical protein